MVSRRRFWSVRRHSGVLGRRVTIEAMFLFHYKTAVFVDAYTEYGVECSGAVVMRGLENAKRGPVLSMTDAG